MSLVIDGHFLKDFNGIKLLIIKPLAWTPQNLPPRPRNQWPPPPLASQMRIAITVTSVAIIEGTSEADTILCLQEMRRCWYDSILSLNPLDFFSEWYGNPMVSLVEFFGRWMHLSAFRACYAIGILQRHNRWYYDCIATSFKPIEHGR